MDASEAILYQSKGDENGHIGTEKQESIFTLSFILLYNLCAIFIPLNYI